MPGAGVASFGAERRVVCNSRDAAGVVRGIVQVCATHAVGVTQHQWMSSDFATQAGPELRIASRAQPVHPFEQQFTMGAMADEAAG